GATDGVPSHLQGDATRLRQVLVNLLDNAVKFTKQGQIEIEVAKTRETDHNVTVRVSVRDTGIGIQEQVRGRLFHLFSQADSSSTRTYGGTGIGLALCEKIITLMGGDIGFESEWGKGS